MSRSNALLFLAAAVTLASCTDECIGPLSEVGSRCPPTFDGTEAQLPACDPAWALQTVHICDDLIALGAGYIGGAYCHYDATTHQLVGATEASDVLAFCGRASSTRNAGRQPARSCLEATPAIRRTCS